MTKDDIKYLDEWLKQGEELARNISALAEKENIQAIFTISATAKMRDKNPPFFSPTRRLHNGFVAGAIVYSQTQALLLCQKIDGIVHRILVDAEKKLPIQIGEEKVVLEHFGIQPISQSKNSRVYIEMGNLSAACRAYIKKSHFQEYKPNDMTVEAAWHFLSSWFGILSGKKIAVIGGGNIGFKLALKLVESGVHVELVRRDLSRGTLMADAINIIKPKATVAIAHYNSDALQASLFCDAIVGCTSGIPVITWDMIQSMKPEGVIIDVGKGSVYQSAARNAVEGEIPIIRCDISSAINGLISTIYRNHEVMYQERGRQELEKGICVVSGGYLGLDGDIVVDNYKNPEKVIGLADGMGDLKINLSVSEQKRLETVREEIQNGQI